MLKLNIPMAEILSELKKGNAGSYPGGKIILPPLFFIFKKATGFPEFWDILQNIILPWT